MSSPEMESLSGLGSLPSAKFHGTQSGGFSGCRQKNTSSAGSFCLLRHIQNPPWMRLRKVGRLF